MVIVDNIFVAIQNQVLLKSVSCSLLSSRITTFIGKSGAGKTTLLRSLAGLVSTAYGTMLIDGKALSSLSSRERSEAVGYVFQDFNLFPHRTVLQNCIDPLIVHGMTHEQAQDRALDMLQELEMCDYRDKYPSELSGGQAQRVAIVRALCLKPRVLLLDEPTASLDPLNTGILVGILQKLAEQGLTIGLSSQDMSFVRKVFDRVYYIQSGEIVEYCDDPELLQQCPAILQFM